MDPAWVLAAESLASKEHTTCSISSIIDTTSSIDQHAGRSCSACWCWSTGSSSSFGRSPAQVALHIPTSVIVLAGLVEAAVNNNASAVLHLQQQQQQQKQQQQQQRDVLFERLQTLHNHHHSHQHQHNEKEAHQQQQQQRSSHLLLFRWSPNLRPTPEWQAVIDFAVTQRKLELEQRAAQIARDLSFLLTGTVKHNTNTNTFSNHHQTNKAKNCKRKSRAAQCQTNSHRNKSNPLLIIGLADPDQLWMKETEKDKEDEHVLEQGQDSDDDDDDIYDNENDEWRVTITSDGMDENQRPSGEREHDDKAWTPVQRRNSKPATTTPSATTATTPLRPPMPDPKCGPQPTNNSSSSQISTATDSIRDPIAKADALGDDNNVVTPTGMVVPPSSKTKIGKAPIPSSAFDTTLGHSLAAVADVTQEYIMSPVDTATLTLEGISPSPTFFIQQPPPPASSSRQDGSTTGANDEADLVVALRRQLQLERSDHDAAVQALQLRLYIAETRLKTYGDALAEHNRVVSDNIVAVERMTPDRTGFREVSRVLRNPNA